MGHSQRYLYHILLDISFDFSVRVCRFCNGSQMTIESRLAHESMSDIRYAIWLHLRVRWREIDNTYSCMSLESGEYGDC